MVVVGLHPLTLRRDGMLSMPTSKLYSIYVDGKFIDETYREKDADDAFLYYFSLGKVACITVRMIE